MSTNVPYSTTPLYADNLSSIHATLNNGNASTLFLEPNLIKFSDTVNLMNLSASVINFSDPNGKSSVTTTSLNINTSSGASLSLYGNNQKLYLNTSGVLDISATSVTLNGTQAPATSGQALIANDSNGGLKWFTITDLLNLEAGIYTNLTSDINANITFGRQYASVPAVVITPDSDSSGQIIPVSLNGVTTTNFSVIFGSNKLKKFSFVVLPVNSSFSVNTNQMTSGDNVSISQLNDPTFNVST